MRRLIGPTGAARLCAPWHVLATWLGPEIARANPNMKFKQQPICALTFTALVASQARAQQVTTVSASPAAPQQMNMAAASPAPAQPVSRAAAPAGQSQQILTVVG